MSVTSLSETPPATRKVLPPLENGDRMDVQEFRRRAAVLPDGVKAELIEGQVYIQPHGPAADYLLDRTDLTIPPLENGDQLDIDEFERRWAALPNLRKVELLDGEVFMAAAAVSADFHARPHAYLAAWLGSYAASTPGVDVLIDPTIRLGRKNAPQPDACLLILPPHGGRAAMSPDGYLVGAPELVVEIAGSTVGRDLNRKLKIYLEHGVREYLVYRAYDGEVDFFTRMGDAFVRQPTDPDPIHRSAVFPGLWLNVNALVAGKLTELLASLSEGIASSEHAEFAKRLAGG